MDGVVRCLPPQPTLLLIRKAEEEEVAEPPKTKSHLFTEQTVASC